MIDKILRNLPIFKGKQRLARILLKYKISRLQDLSFQGKYGCIYKVPNLKENIGFELFINGVYEEEIINFITHHMPKDGVLLDVGANIGAITLPICKQQKNIRALCIEASPRVYHYLQYNIEQNHLQNCIVINKAVTETENETVDFFSPVEKFGKGSLGNIFTQEAEKVETITLNSILTQNIFGKVDFIKIDIEGHEYAAFKGGDKVLTEENSPDILFEFVDWAEGLAKNYKPGDAQQLLLNYGFRLFKLSKAGRLSEIDTPLVKGAAMILASKKKKQVAYFN